MLIALDVLEEVVAEGTTTSALLLADGGAEERSLGCCWARMRLRLPLPPSMTTRPLMFDCRCKGWEGVVVARSSTGMYVMYLSLANE